MKAATIIVAGGRGNRLGSSLPKQFLPLLDKPLLVHTLEAFEKNPLIHSIVLVLPFDYTDYFRSEILTRFYFSKIEKIVCGGETRQASTRAGFEALDSSADLVAVHDAARPLVSPSLIEACLQGAQIHGAAIAARPALDTIKQVNEEGWIVQTHPRERIYLAETPQVFQYSILKNALEWALEKNFEGTDEASLIEAWGGRVKIIPSDGSNLKVTTPQDLEWIKYRLNH